MRAVLAVWRVSLRRTVADWPIVAAAWLITLLAATLVAGATIYPAAAAQAGLLRALQEAPAEQVVVVVSRYATAEQASAADALVSAELDRVVGRVGGSVVRDWRTSATLSLPPIGGSESGDQAVLGSIDALAEHATLVDGAWPAATTPGVPMEVVVVGAVAQELGLHVGDVVPLVAHAAGRTDVPVRLAGIFSVDRPEDPYWEGDQQLVTGIVESSRYRTFGPFLGTPDALASSGAGSLRQRWRATPDFDALVVEEASALRGRLAALAGRLESGGGTGYEARSGLGTILGGVERSLLVSQTGVLLLIAQLLILAAYAIVLTASLLVDHRRVDTALLRSRGAGAWQVAALAFVEGLVLAAPATLLAPWVAAGALQLLNAAGPLADVGIRIDPRVTTDAYLGAGISGLACAALLVLPAFVSARSFAAEHGSVSRQETRTFGQRMGLDLALLALTGVALWQLRLYGAPLTRTVQGTLGIDPLLVAAPAIGMIAGGVLALRVLPLLAEAVEAAFTRGRDLVLSLGSRQLARRPLRYTRSALLLMLAMSMGVFGLSYAATWATSQRDQAAYQAGADLRVKPSDRGGVQGLALGQAYAALDGVERLSPVERLPSRVQFSSGPSDVLALDAETASEIVLAREDDTTTPLATLLAPLRDGRPAPTLLELPAEAAYLRIVPAFDRDWLGRWTWDPETETERLEPIGPDEPVEVLFGAGAVVRDALGVLHRFESKLVPIEGPVTEILVPLGTPAGGSGPSVDGSLAVAEVGVEIGLPPGIVLFQGAVGVAALAAGPGEDGPWADIELDPGRDWQARIATGRQAPELILDSRVVGPTIVLSPENPIGHFFFGAGSPRTAARLAFLPAALVPAGGPVPVLANRAFLEVTSSEVGETIATPLEGARRQLVITGVVETFPTTDPARALLIVDGPTLQLLRLDGTGLARSPDEWWLAVADGADEPVAAALRAAPFESANVLGFADRTRALSSDPVALGVIGALALGFAVTGLFAVVGLVVSGAVSARQRRTEFALLRALGLSGRQLFGSLWLENGSVVLVSLLAGTGLGLLIAWIALPFITVTQAAAAPVPAVIVQVPWDRILGLEVVSALALAVAVVLIGVVLRRLGVGGVLRMGED